MEAQVLDSKIVNQVVRDGVMAIINRIEGMDFEVDSEVQEIRRKAAWGRYRDKHREDRVAYMKVYRAKKKLAAMGVG